jgi:hypothetical protein
MERERHWISLAGIMTSDLEVVRKTMTRLTFNEGPIFGRSDPRRQTDYLLFRQRYLSNMFAVKPRMARGG